MDFSKTRDEARRVVRRNKGEYEQGDLTLIDPDMFDDATKAAMQQLMRKKLVEEVDKLVARLFE
jgi:hypothetical protein